VKITSCGHHLRFLRVAASSNPAVSTDLREKPRRPVTFTLGVSNEGAFLIRWEYQMKVRFLSTVVCIATLAFSQCVCADEIDGKAIAFAKSYSDICIRNLPNLEGLRTRLSANIPKFPPAQAALFLKGNEGDAWPVPSKEYEGNFVLALWANKNFCSLFGRRAKSQDAEKLFVQLVEKAPQPFVSVRKDDTWAEAAPNGKRHTISYVWSMPDAKRKFLFTLTTADSDSADLQALASAAIMSE